MLYIQGNLEYYFSLFNKKFFENKLPKVVITVQTKGKNKSGVTCFTTNAWGIKDGDRLDEINVNAESLILDTPTVIASLLHEMVHVYNRINNVIDVSRSGKHNITFRDVAESVMLKCIHSEKYGYGNTEPTNELVEFIKSQPHYVDYNIYRIEKPVKPPKEKLPSWKYTCLCGVVARTNKEVGLRCLGCNQDMESEWF